MVIEVLYKNVKSLKNLKDAVHRPTFLKRKISVIFCFEYKLRKLIICIPQKLVKLKPLKLVNTIPRFEIKFMHLSENSCSKLIIKIQAHFKKFFWLKNHDLRST